MIRIECCLCILTRRKLLFLYINNEHFELAKRIDKDFRPKNAKEKEFWEDVGRLSENTLQVKGLSGEDAFRSKYGENALIGAKEYTEYMRGNYDRWIKEANEVRRMLGKDEIEYRKNYMPHIEKEKGFFGKILKGSGQSNRIGYWN